MISWLESESEHFFKLVESSMMYHCQSDCELLKIIIKKDSNYLSMLTSEDVVDFKMLPVFEKRDLCLVVVLQTLTLRSLPLRVSYKEDIIPMLVLLLLLII